MVVVALGAGSLNGYFGVLAAFETHAHGPYAMHTHAAAHAHGAQEDAHGHHEAEADVAQDQSGGDPGACEHACEHRHAHCCSTFAVPAAEYGTHAVHGRATVAVAQSLLPHGQLASPLFRPPRAAA